jgi:hypothetical protein
VLRVSVALSVAVVALPPSASPRTMIRFPAVTLEPNAIAAVVPGVALNVPVPCTTAHAMPPSEPWPYAATVPFSVGLGLLIVSVPLLTLWSLVYAM